MWAFLDTSRWIRQATNWLQSSWYRLFYPKHEQTFTCDVRSRRISSPRLFLIRIVRFTGWRAGSGAPDTEYLMPNIPKHPIPMVHLSALSTNCILYAIALTFAMRQVCAGEAGQPFGRRSLRGALIFDLIWPTTFHKIYVEGVIVAEICLTIRLAPT